MNDSRMLKPALIGGVLLGILSSVPFISLFNCFCCAWVIVGGVVAAYLYVKESPTPVTLGGGVALGLIAGIIGSFVSALFSIPLRMLTHQAGIDVMEQMKHTLDQLPNVPPETRELIAKLSTQGNLGTTIFIVGLLGMLVIYSLFAMIGGAIGIAIFEKRKPGSAPGNPPPYLPPTGAPPPPPDGV